MPLRTISGPMPAGSPSVIDSFVLAMRDALQEVSQEVRRAEAAGFRDHGRPVPAPATHARDRHADGDLATQVEALRPDSEAEAQQGLPAGGDEEAGRLAGRRGLDQAGVDAAGGLGRGAGGEV